MQLDEFREIAYLLKNAWPGQFQDDNEGAYAEFLLGYDMAIVRAALHKLTQDGTVFVPSAGQIVAAIRALSEPLVPSWTEVWSQIERAMAGRPQDLHPFVARFVEHEGLKRLRLTPFYDPDRGDMRIHQLRTRWDEFAGVQQAAQGRHRALTAARVPELSPAQQQQALLLERSVAG